VRHDDRHAGPDGTLSDDEWAVTADDRRMPDADAGNVGDRVVRPGHASADPDSEIPGSNVQLATSTLNRRALSEVRGGAPRRHRPEDSALAAYDRAVIHASGDRSATAPPAAAPPVCLVPLPELAGVRPIDAAEALRDLPGLALLETARPGRRARWTYLTADPVAILDRPAPGRDPFADARRLVARLADAPPSSPDGEAPPFVGGFVGYLAYDLGHALERLPTIAPDDQGLPLLHLALHDWVVAWDRRTGAAWIGGRAVDGDATGLDRRIEAVVERLRQPAPRAAASEPIDPLAFTSSLDRDAYLAGVESIRESIARGEIYQANLTRRLEAPFAGEPWPLYRRLRTGDPSLYAAYLDLGRRRAILSASPEPFLAVDRAGHVTTDPIKGTRPRGRTREQDRALACELLASAKDRAENVMIVDVLRNDLGRVCMPGTVRVPRLCRLERTAAVQHLVSTVTGRLAPGRDAFDLLAASFPGGSITGAPKIRAMQLLEELEPVRRGPYTGAFGWIGPDGAMATSILIRTLVADGRRLSLHVGGGITYRSNPAAEWDETVAKASGPLGAVGGREIGS
jgi:para-aminobenzoate synthetase component 1